MTRAVTRQQYCPYGATRFGGLTQTDKPYTGQQQEPGDAALGLYYYHARFYSTTVDRFVSADTTSTDGPNRYTYVADNPIRNTDPSGHGVTNDDGTSCPATRPDCLNDGGPGPVGGTGQPTAPSNCDTACQWRGAAVGQRAAPVPAPDTGQVGGGRSGEKVKDLKGPPNSIIKGFKGRVYVTDGEGRVIRDITAERVKDVIPGVGFAGSKRAPTAQELKWVRELWP